MFSLITHNRVEVDVIGVANYELGQRVGGDSVLLFGNETVYSSKGE